MEIEAELSFAARVKQSLAPQSSVWNAVSIETYYTPHAPLAVTSAWCFLTPMKL
jgi:hypothetical protein